MSFKNSETKSTVVGNPLLMPFNTAFEVPPFDLIKPYHFREAFSEAIKQQDAEIKAITENPNTPDFENTIAALDYSGSLLARISSVFFSLTSANTSDSLQKIQKDIMPVLTQHDDNILLNTALFKRIKAIRDAHQNLKLTSEQAMLLDKTYKRFVKSGAGLDAAKQLQLRKINEKLASLSVNFGDNLLKETKAFKLIIENKADLSGLPASLIETAAEDAGKAHMNGKWLFTLDNASIMPFLTYADNRSLREKMLRGYMMRGNNNNVYDNKEVMKQMVNLRSEKALLLGYKDFASLQLDDRMAKNPENAYKLLHELWTPALKAARAEAGEMEACIKNEGESFALQPWDWRYYAEKVRKVKYDLDEEQLRPYFALDSVRKGAFLVAHKLYGITFSEINNIPKYHPDNKIFEVKDKDGSHLGILYMDFHPRDSKRGGAWCGSFRDQYKINDKTVSPVVTVVCNFSKPDAGGCALLNLDETQTLFHEFGHALQALCSNVTYPGLSGLVRDYVELPSQVMENWATDPEVLNLYAHHYKTGNPMPKELLEKINQSRFFNEGFATVEYLAASFLDMDLHTIPAPDANLNILKFEDQSMQGIGLIPEILPRYRITYFNHISDDGYSAGYYAYVWAQVLDADAFAAFKEKGVFDQSTATLFRKYVLEKGGSQDEMDAYKHFRGTEPSIIHLLKRKGFEVITTPPLTSTKTFP